MHMDEVAAELLVNELGLLVLEAIDDGANTETIFSALASLVEATIRLSEDDDVTRSRALFAKYLMLVEKAK